MKFLSVIFKLVDTPDEFPEALKLFSHIIFRFMDPLPETNMIFIQLIITKKSYGCRKISYRARQHWNSLPSSLKNEKSFTKFKASVKNIILANTNKLQNS